MLESGASHFNCGIMSFDYFCHGFDVGSCDLRVDHSFTVEVMDEMMESWYWMMDSWV